MILMFIFSNQKGETSSKVSNTIAEAMNIESDNKWVEPSVQPLMLGLNLRKYAHIIIYFFMGVSAWRRADDESSSGRYGECGKSH